MTSKDYSGVCASCFSDYALKDFVKKNLVVEWCSFCGKKSKKLIGADISVVASYFLDCLWLDYDIPENHLYYDSDEESGWLTGGLVTVYDGYDLIHDEFYDCFNNEDLLDYFVSYVSDYQFIRQNFERLDAKELYKYSWETFTDTVKHHRRFVLSRYRDESFSEEEDQEVVEPAHFVDFISNLIIEHSLVTEIPIETCFYRVRVHKDTLEKSAKVLGTSPIEHANYSNRMSPAGIPMFYGALDKETALIETIDTDKARAKGKQATIGVFKTMKPLRVVDFTNLPTPPSLFDEKKRELRDGISILQAFTRDLSAPVKKDGREHIEYVPTQIVTEHLRDLFKPQKQHINGIYFPSSRNGKNACVLFVDNVKCVDKADEEKGFL